MKSAKSKILVSSAAFLSDDTLLTANSIGEFIVWAPVPGDDGSLDFMQRVFPGHEVRDGHGEKILLIITPFPISP